MYNRDYMMEHYASRILLVKELKDEGCSMCGEMDIRCLDMHHRDPSTKLFTLSMSNWARSMKSWVEEVAKCDVLCSNCHRKLHYDNTKSF